MAAAINLESQATRAIRVGVFVGLLEADERLLLVHRADWDMWCLPGGLLEHGESVTDAARRECYEELGLKVQLRCLVGVYSDPGSQVFSFRNGNCVQYVTIVFAGKIPRAPLRPDIAEVRAAGMFSQDQLPNLVPSHRLWIPDVFRASRGPFVR